MSDLLYRWEAAANLAANLARACAGWASRETVAAYESACDLRDQLRAEIEAHPDYAFQARGGGS